MQPRLSALYVYITLPGATMPVVCGRLTAIPIWDGSGGDYHYVCGRSYLAKDEAIAIEPFTLPLRLETWRTGEKHLFGIFGDAMPDFWGRRVPMRRPMI